MDNSLQSLEDKLRVSGGVDFIENQVDAIFRRIANTNNIDEAESLFKSLDDIQFVLAKAVFKDNMKVSSFLRQFIYDFDRIDDFVTKKFEYQKIKSLYTQ